VNPLLLITALLNLKRAQLHLGCFQLTLDLHHDHLYVIQAGKFKRRVHSMPKTQNPVHSNAWDLHFSSIIFS